MDSFLTTALRVLSNTHSSKISLLLSSLSPINSTAAFRVRIQRSPFLIVFTGQTLVDDISAAMYNVVFTSMPILLFSLLDRPMGSSVMMRFPQIYNHAESLSTIVFWKTGILQGVIDGALCFYIPMYSITASGPEAIDGVWAVGKVVFIAILGAVTLEACLVARYWTSTFFIFVFLSYFLVYPFFLLFPFIERGLSIYDESQYGVAEDLFSTWLFWFIIVGIYALTFGIRCVCFLKNSNERFLGTSIDR